MRSYTVKAKLLSETVLGSGAGVAGGVDIDVVRNDDGCHYIKATTLKGLVREQLEWFGRIEDGALKDAIAALVGTSDSASRGKLKFWDLTAGKSDRRNEKVRWQTAIDAGTGVARDGSLRSVTVICEGAEFDGLITENVALTDDEQKALSSAVRAIKHIGTNRTRGKGRIDMALYLDGKPVPGMYEV